MYLITTQCVMDIKLVRPCKSNINNSPFLFDRWYNVVKSESCLSKNSPNANLCDKKKQYLALRNNSITLWETCKEYIGSHHYLECSLTYQAYMKILNLVVWWLFSNAEFITIEHTNNQIFKSIIQFIVDYQTSKFLTYCGILKTSREMNTKINWRFKYTM